MDSLNQPDNTVNTQTPPVSQSRLHEVLKKKWVLIGIGIVTLGLISVFFFLSVRSKSEPKTINQPLPTVIPTQPLLSPTSPFTPEQLKIIEEQRKADETVGKREIEIKTKYPWFNSLPLRGEKYFVYFDTNKQVFVGLLYPKSVDNVEIIKQEVKLKLRDTIGITDIDKYQFQWTITPE